MIVTLLFHLLATAVVLAVFYPLMVLLLRVFQPSAALVHRIAWAGVLVIPFFALSLPVSIPVTEKEVGVFLPPQRAQSSQREEEKPEPRHEQKYEVQEEDENFSNFSSVPSALLMFKIL